MVIDIVIDAVAGVAVVFAADAAVSTFELQRAGCPAPPPPSLVLPAFFSLQAIFRSLEILRRCQK